MQRDCLGNLCDKEGCVSCDGQDKPVWTRWNFMQASISTKLRHCVGSIRNTSSMRSQWRSQSPRDQNVLTRNRPHCTSQHRVNKTLTMQKGHTQWENSLHSNGRLLGMKHLDNLLKAKFWRGSREWKSMDCSHQMQSQNQVTQCFLNPCQKFGTHEDTVAVCHLQSIDNIDLIIQSSPLTILIKQDKLCQKVPDLSSLSGSVFPDESFAGTGLRFHKNGSRRIRAWGTNKKHKHLHQLP